MRRVRGLDHDVATWLAHHAAIRGERTAVVDAERRLDYRSLAERSARCAGVLADAGVGRGDRVALLLGNRSAYLETLFAAATLGAIAVPLNARLTPRELAGLLDDSTPSLLLHEAALTERARDACQRAAQPPASRLACGAADDSPDAYEAALATATPLGPAARPGPPAVPDDPLILMYTSGTTGVPKGALLPLRKTLYNSENAAIFFRLTPDDRALVVLPLFHSFGLLILAVPTLYAGGTVHLAPRFDPAAVWETVATEKITFLGGVPTMFRALHDALPQGVDTTSLRFLFTAGAAIPVQLIRAFERRGLLLKQGFGQTETSILCCLDSGDALRKAGSVGRPVSHAELRVVATDTVDRPTGRWQDAAVGETGEIVVRGPIAMLGYWKQPEATAEVLRGDWLRTGDLASVDTEGFVTLVGRARDMYISGGENVYPAEVEGVFAEHPAIREIAVVGEPDPRWGEVGCAYVVPEPGVTLDPEALQEWASQRLADFKQPRRFVALKALPRTASGKVQKHRLGAAAD